MTAALFESIIQNGTMTGTTFFISTICSLSIGLFITYIYTLKNRYTKSFLITLVLLPAIVQLVIMLVNGNIGAGVAVAGAFSLVRFRSAAGTGQEITAIFLSMAVGLATGMGYIAIAIVFSLTISLAALILNQSHFGESGAGDRILHITIPEDLDFEGVFDDIFNEYTEKAENIEVRTAGMGSLYKLDYKIKLKNGVSLKDMIDQIRQRNGNLEVACKRPVTPVDEL